MKFLLAEKKDSQKSRISKKASVFKKGVPDKEFLLAENIAYSLLAETIQFVLAEYLDKKCISKILAKTFPKFTWKTPKVQ